MKTKPKLKALTYKRNEYTEELKKIEPTKVASFTFPTELIKLFADKNIKLLINTRSIMPHHIFPENWEIRTNNKIHKKIAIGKNGVILGSWNFTDNSTYNLHEVGISILNDEIIKEYEKYFDNVWVRSAWKKQKSL